MKRKSILFMIIVVSLAVSTGIAILMNQATPINAQAITRAELLQKGLDRAIRFGGLQVDPQRSESYLTEVVETTYLKWIIWQGVGIEATEEALARRVFVRVYSGEFKDRRYHPNGGSFRFHHYIVAYFLDTGFPVGSTLVNQEATPNLDSLR